MRRQTGFSLIELLIVVAVILIIAAIAVPNAMRARRAANEASAVNSVRTITSAEVIYNAAYPATGYTCTLAYLGPNGSDCATPDNQHSCLIDSALATGDKAQYTFTMDAGSCAGPPSANYFVTAVPRPGGVRKFCADASGVIRFELGAADCTITSLPY